MLQPAPLKGPLVLDSDQPVYYFFDRLFVFIGGQAAGEIFNKGFSPLVVANIDSTVHNPWLLNNNSAKWRDQFGYSAEKLSTTIIAGTLPGMSVYSRERALRDPALSPYTVDDAVGIAKTLGTRIAGDLQPDVAIDYGVHRVAEMPFFPKTPAGWHNVERSIGDHGVPLIFGVLALGGVANLGALSLGSNPIHLHSKEYALGWRASVRHFGFKLTPDLRVGPAFTSTRGIELNASVVEHVNAVAGTEKTGLDFSGKLPLVRPDAKGYGWDVGLIANGHLFLDDDNSKEHGQFRLSTDLYFKRSDLLDQGRNNQLVGDVNFSTNFKSQSALTTSVGLSDYNTDTTLSLYARISRDVVDPAGNANVFGLFVSGVLESQTPMLAGKMRASGRRVQKTLGDYLKIEAVVEGCRVSAQSQTKAPAPISPYIPFASDEARRQYERNTAGRDCLDVGKKLEEARRVLQREFTEFLSVRTDYFMHEGRESRNAITDGDGPLEASELREIRKKIGLPEYEAANLGEKNLVPPEKVHSLQRARAGAAGVPSPAPGSAGAGKTTLE